ncbi:MAG TPA: NADH-quinone oxidoreductase subunit D [Dehalococcoidia bacterium]|nr:NADH-quinone oxidoreductase subunit D [Dehalococcoidia bacterium]
MKTEPFVVNVGPQHPSTHGVFRLRLTLDGERILDADMIVGYLHRSMEKLAESRTYTQNIPFTDRVDYMSAMVNNLAYCMAVEKLVGIEVPPRGQFLRVIMAEFQRIANHAMAIGAFLNDCGAFYTPIQWMFRERERILDLFEMTCGARLTLNYMRIGGVSYDIPPEFMPAARALLKEMPQRISEYEALLLENEILIARTRNIGVLSADRAIGSSVSGPVLRGSGVAWDIRKADPYCVYDQLDFDIPVGTRGDCYDRFLVRMEELRQSVHILEQALDMLPGGPASVPVPLALRPPPGEVYARIEAPKGELGFYVVSDGSPHPYRWHIRAPSFINLTPLKDMVVGLTLADAIITLGSIDITLGEVDR